MNIYINVEVAIRELASRLFLGYLAAQRGHNVLVSDLATFKRLLRRDALPVGIFHDKAITPHAGRLELYKQLDDRGFLITSQDEEHGLLSDSYDSFARTRFSIEALRHVKTVFCWGSHDYGALRRIYSTHTEKFVLTGSPRADLWAGRFAEVTGSDRLFSDRPFVLYSSNLAINSPELHWKTIARIREMGYLERDSEARSEALSARGEQFLLQACIAPILEAVAAEFPDLDVIVRPHPVEDERAWSDILQPLPNLKVMKEGAIGPWVKCARAVIHNGCTTAFEATLAGTPVFTLRPLSGLQHEREVPNRFGVTVSTAEEIIDFLSLETLRENAAFTKKISEDEANLSSRIRLDSTKLAAEKIVAYWDSLAGAEHISRNLVTVSSIANGAILKSRIFIARGIRRALRFRRTYEPRQAIDKFAPLSRRQIDEQLSLFVRSFPGKKVDSKLISPRSVAIWPKR